MPLFETLPINEEEVRTLVSAHWSLKLGKCLKASQNHTFEATNEENGKKYIVRATPDPKRARHDSIVVELALLNTYIQIIYQYVVLFQLQVLQFKT